MSSVSGICFRLPSRFCCERFGRVKPPLRLEIVRLYLAAGFARPRQEKRRRPDRAISCPAAVFCGAGMREKDPAPCVMAIRMGGPLGMP